MGQGFSTATNGADAFKHLKKNSRATFILSYLSLLTNMRFPLKYIEKSGLVCIFTLLTLQRYVHGGWATTKSHRGTLLYVPS